MAQACNRTDASNQKVYIYIHDLNCRTKLASLVGTDFPVDKFCIPFQDQTRVSIEMNPEVSSIQPSKKAVDQQL